MGERVIIITPSEDGKITKLEFIEMFAKQGEYEPLDDSINLIKVFEDMMAKKFFDIEKYNSFPTYVIKRYINPFIKKFKPIARSNC